MNRCFIVLIALVLGALGSAQNLFLSWSELASTYPSQNQGGAFVNLGRSVLFTRNPMGSFVVCKNPDGSTAWTHELPEVGDLQSILTTTDNIIYLTVRKATGNSYLYVMTTEGNHLWWFNYTIGNAPNRQLTEMRIFGNSLLVAGRGRIGGSATDPRTVLFSFDRFSGSTNYARELLIGGVNIFDGQKLRSAGGYAYLLATRSSATGISKINPATGQEVGYYAVSPFFARDYQVDSAGSIYVTGYVSQGLIGIQPETRKINGSGAGLFPIVFRTLVGGEQLLLSAGSPYLVEVSSAGRGLRRIKGSNGAPIWFRSIPTTDSLDALRADASGRIYMIRNTNDAINGPNWAVNIVNPASGEDMDTHIVAASDPGTVSTIGRTLTLNTYGELLTCGTVYEEMASGNHERGVSALIYQTPEPVDDFYTVVQGQTLATSGNGLMSNDKYTNPQVTFVAKVTNSGPSAGYLTLQSNGELTYKPSTGNGYVPIGVQSFRYRVTRGNVSREGQVFINVTRALSQFTLSRYSTAGASDFGGTVYLTSAASSSAAVTLTDNSAYVTTPTSVVVLANQSMRAFPIGALEVTSSSTATITASYGGVSISRSIELVPIGLGSMSLSPTTIIGGNDVLMTVNLNATATSPVTVDLTSDSIYFPVPPSITFPVGESYAGFYVRTVHPPVQVTAVVTASQGGTVITKSVKIKP